MTFCLFSLLQTLKSVTPPAVILFFHPIIAGNWPIWRGKLDGFGCFEGGPVLQVREWSIAFGIHVTLPPPYLYIYVCRHHQEYNIYVLVRVCT